MLATARRSSYLDTEVPTVNIVAQEQVACLCGVSTDFEKLHQVVVLAVNITADCDGSIHLQEVGL